MKWLPVSSNSRHEIYDLFNNEEKLLSLSFQADTGSLRIHLLEERRNFTLEKLGFLRSRTVIRNEYGVSIAELMVDDSEKNSGTISLDGQKYHYSFQKERLPEIVIYKNSEPLLICQVDNSVKKWNHRNAEGLILVLCWYEFVSAEKKHLKMYA
jgi:hypothetical protein